MMTMLLTLLVGLMPFASVVAMLTLCRWLGARRVRCVEEQIALTDAIHRELGAVAAPCVHQSLRGAWQVAVAVPVDRPETVAAIVAIAQRVVGRLTGPSRRPVEILLTPAVSAATR